jgi:5'-nucleotidase
MRILLTNDDGVNAPGLVTLESIARSLSDDVWIVAPEADQSGSSHSLTVQDPLRMREIGERRYSVRGTPTDCVIMAMRHVLDPRPDLVLSGVNRGQNMADDVTYSGTVAGAMEGTLLGVRSIALSQCFGGGAPDYGPGEVHGPALIRRLLETRLPAEVLININFPDCPADEVKGTQITVQGKRDQSLMKVEARRDGRGEDYFWVTFDRSQAEPPEGTDLKACYDGYISVTPIQLDLTDHALHRRLKDEW